MVVMVEEKGKQAAGEKEARKPWTLRELWGKPVWDWLALLIIPAALVFIGSMFAAVQDFRQQAIEDARAQREQKLADQSANVQALQAYFDQMSTLLIEKDLRNSEQGSEMRTLARAYTLTVLGRVDGFYKTAVIKFLEEAGLVQITGMKDQDTISTTPPVVSLARARLQGADLSEQGTVTNLEGADLSGANLEAADLSGANLEDANLEGDYLSNTDLSNTDLSGANLNEATGWTQDQLTTVRTLEGATMPDGQILKGDDNPNGPTFEEWLESKDRGEDGGNNGPS